MGVETSLEESKRAIIRALADDQARLILTTTIHAAKSVMDITREQAIPITSAYRKVKELKASGLLKVERIIVTDDGKKYELFRSSIRSANVRFDRGTLDVDVAPNVQADEKMLKRFFTLREVR